MFIKIQGVTVMFRAVESFKVEGDTVVVRTVSGHEYTRGFASEAQAQGFVEGTIERMAVCEAL